VLYGSADFCGGVAARRAGALAVTFLSGFAALAVLFAGMPLAPGVTRVSDLGWGLAGGAFGGMGAMLVYRAIAIGPVSVASPIFSVTGLALPALVGFALGERPSGVALAGLGLAPVSILLLARSGTSPSGQGRDAHPDPRRVIAPSLIAGVVIGFFLTFLGRIEAGANLWPLVGARLAGQGVLLAALLARREPVLPAPAARRMALLAGALDSLANLAYVAAVQRGALSLVAALVSLAPATSVLLARAVFAERWNAHQRAGLLLALLAGVCISVG
jgi:drug/metabolite transporter (DMT)-like permease